MKLMTINGIIALAHLIHNFFLIWLIKANFLGKDVKSHRGWGEEKWHQMSHRGTGGGGAYMSLAKNLGGRIAGWGKFLGGEGSNFFWKFHCRFVIIWRGPKNFLKKMAVFKPKKSKISSKMPF
jgi:hypothetical protein